MDNERMKTSLIWDDKQASEWAEAYPIGNGRIGGMVYGGICKEVIALNHDLLWRSYLKQPTYATHNDIEEIKTLCGQKMWGAAKRVLEKTMIQSGASLYINPYVPAFDLYVNLFRLDDDRVYDYKRTLDLERGITKTEFSYEGVRYERTAFCSYEYGVMVVHISTSVPGRLWGNVSISRMLDAECAVMGECGYGYLKIFGQFEEGKNFGGVVRVLNHNGRVTLGKCSYGLIEEQCPEKQFGFGYVFNRDEYLSDERGVSVNFDTCDGVTLLVAIATDNEAEDPVTYCMKKTEGLPCYKTLLDKHIEYFQSVYNRTQLHLEEESISNVTTRQLITKEREKETLTPYMIELMYNASKYIAISSGMPQKKGEVDKAPINLQGIWCRDTRPAWESDYHIDLNVEMCYWPLVSAGLIEWYEPFVAWIERLMPQAEYLASDVYGAHGAAFNGCCDPWVLGSTDMLIAGWLGGSAWLGQILWIYYEHDLREETLKRIYPILLKIAEFLEDMLIMDNNGDLIFPFGSSPEMRINVDGEAQSLSSAATCDLSLAKELFAHIYEAAKILGEAQTTIEKYRNLMEKICSLPINKNGRLQEWIEDHEEVEPGHRHRSPLIGLCPGTLINYRSAPTETKAMEQLVDYRMAAGTKLSASFSYPWDAQILARLHRGDDALKALTPIIQHTIGNMMVVINDYEGKGVGVPWFIGDKIVQVEAQICLLSAIAEMIYQDNDGVITPLAALPKGLKSGNLTGITGRNGFVVDIFWTEEKLDKMNILSKNGRKCKIKIPIGQRLLETREMKINFIEQDVFEFDTKKGESYSLKFKAIDE